MVHQLGVDFGSTRQSYGPLLPNLFFAARIGGLTFEGDELPSEILARYQLPSAACSGHSMQAMRNFVTRCLESNRWAILQFHGIGGGHKMDCDLAAYRDLINWLADHHADKIVTIREGVIQTWNSDKSLQKISVSSAGV